MDFSRLSDEQKEALRVLLGRTSSDPLPSPPDLKELDRLLMRSGLMAADTRRKTIANLRHITGLWPTPRVTPYDGPRIILDGTIASMQASWEDHLDDLIDVKRKSGPVVRHHREALARYCRALGIDWHPRAEVYEKRAKLARQARSENIRLPDDFVALAHELCSSVVYDNDGTYNRAIQARVRLGFFTAPRFPSEDNRLVKQNVHVGRGVVVYQQSKIAGVEAEPIYVDREVFDLGPAVLTHPGRNSYLTLMQLVRPRLIDRISFTGVTNVDHDYVHVGPNGLPSRPEYVRQQVSLAGKTVWPNWYGYMMREVGIIMKALEIRQELGALDYEVLIQWTGHELLDTLRRYTRKAKQLLREHRPGPELKNLLYEWKQI